MFTLYWRPGKWRPPIENYGPKIVRVKLLYVLYTVSQDWLYKISLQILLLKLEINFYLQTYTNYQL